MSSTDLRKIGSIDLVDLDIISRCHGRDFLPFPFMLTQPSRFPLLDDYIRYARSVLDRFDNGDLRIFKECAESYADADIRVECHIQHIPADTASVRVVAARREQMGFLAQQQPDDDIIDVYELSPYLLGPAVAERAELKKPGRRSAIVIPEYARPPNDSGLNVVASEDITIQHMIECAPDATEVPRAKVTAYGTVQTHWRPTRRWGIDPGKASAVFVSVKDDGDYLYKRDFSEATPVTQPVLSERIDRLISEDVKAIRQFRNG